MTTERWNDQMLDQLADRVNQTTANVNQLSTDIRALVTLAAQQQENMVLMQTEISIAQEEIRQIWRRLDADTNN